MPVCIWSICVRLYCILSAFRWIGLGLKLDSPDGWEETKQTEESVGKKQVPRARPPPEATRTIEVYVTHATSTAYRCAWQSWLLSSPPRDDPPLAAERTDARAPHAAQPQQPAPGKPGGGRPVPPPVLPRRPVRRRRPAAPRVEGADPRRRQPGRARHHAARPGPPGAGRHSPHVSPPSPRRPCCLCTHRQLHSARPPLADVPAVYFVSPTLSNIRRIAEDLNPPLYASYYLAFTSSLPRSLLEELASLILSNDPSGQTGQLIASVTDQFLDFVVPSPNMFSLLPRRELRQDADGAAGKGKKGKDVREEWVEGRGSYVVLNDPRATEVDIEEEVGRIANGLFSVITTMSMSTRCQRMDKG